MLLEENFGMCSGRNLAYAGFLFPVQPLLAHSGHSHDPQPKTESNATASPSEAESESKPSAASQNRKQPVTEVETGVQAIAESQSPTASLTPITALGTVIFALLVTSPFLLYSIRNWVRK